MRPRGRFVIALFVALAAALPSEPAWGQDGPERVRIPVNPVVVLATRVPRTHLFGDRITATVELSVNPALADPRSVRLATTFTPYRLVAPVAQSSERADGRVLLRYSYALQCVEGACLPDVLDEPFRLPPARAHYVPRGGGDEQRISVSWPPLSVGSRLQARDLSAPEFRADLAEPGRPLAQTLTGVALAAAALLVLLAGGLVAWRLRAQAAPSIVSRREDVRPTPLEAFLREVQEAEDGSAEARRTALDRLARSLEAADRPALAARARRLAWSPEPPTPPAVDELVAAVRRDAAEAA